MAVTQTLTEDVERSMAELATSVGARYGGASFDDRDTAAAYWADLRRAGFSGITIPEEFGGAGLGMSALTLVSERLAACGYPAAKLVLAQAVVAPVLIRHADRDTQARWLPAIASGEADVCFALTEGSAGLNAKNIKTTALRTPIGWRIKGEKTYVSSFVDAHLMLIAAQTPEVGGISLFLVEDPSRQMQAVKVPLGFANLDEVHTVFLDDVEVPESGLVGTPGRGLHMTFDGINPERLMTASQAIGVGRWGIARATEFGNERVVFDDPITAYQAVAHPLAEAHISLEAAWLMMRSAATAFDSGDQAGLECSRAKVAACDAGFKAMNSALQTFGGAGFEAQSRLVERFMLMRFYLTVPGTREMSLNHVAMTGLGLPRSY